MPSHAMHFLLALSSASMPAVLSNPIAASSSPKPTGTCKTVQPCVSRLKGWTEASSYCSSIFNAAPTSQVTVTIPGTTSTSTLPVSTITAPASTISTTIIETVTVCGDASSQAPAVNQKRATKSKTTLFPPTPVPSPLKKCIRTNIPYACSCLGYGSVPTITTTTTSDSTITVTPSPDTITVTPPPTTSTATSTTTVVVGTGAGTPTVVLTSPTAITVVNPDGNSTYSYDDQYFTLSLPFEVELFGTSANVLDVSVNGWIALVQGQSSASYINANLPVAPNGGSSGLPDVVFAPYWNDLFIYAGTPQGIYYQIVGEDGYRNVSIEWYTSTYSNPAGYYHFIATLQEAVPGAATFSYHQANGQRPSNTQLLGTIGVQRFSEGVYEQYSFNTPVAPGTELYYDPIANSFTDVSAVTCPVSPSPQRVAMLGNISAKPNTYPDAPPP